MQRSYYRGVREPMLNVTLVLHDDNWIRGAENQIEEIDNWCMEHVGSRFDTWMRSIPIVQNPDTSIEVTYSFFTEEHRTQFSMTWK